MVLLLSMQFRTVQIERFWIWPKFKLLRSEYESAAFSANLLILLTNQSFILSEWHKYTFSPPFISQTTCLLGSKDVTQSVSLLLINMYVRLKNTCLKSVLTYAFDPVKVYVSSSLHFLYFYFFSKKMYKTTTGQKQIGQNRYGFWVGNPQKTSHY